MRSLGFLFFATFLLSYPIVLRADDSLTERRWTVDGTPREALVHIPPSARTRPTPLLFVYHGHGGTMERSASRTGFHEEWPEAIVVYPQGLKTPGILTDTEGKRAGWQSKAGQQGDRDLHFFDAMLESLRKDYQVDDKRVFVTGHSNGGSMAYLLWAERGDALAAVAPTATAAFHLIPKLEPKPAFILAGENDPLVKYAWQKRMISAVLRVNQCAEGKPWGPNCTYHPSSKGKPVVVYVHPGGHELPKEAGPLLVRFFQEQTN